MEDYKSPKQVICQYCNTLVELESGEEKEGKFICPECGKENSVQTEIKPAETGKALLVNDTYAECVHCGTAKEIDDLEIINRSFKCSECGMTNELEIRPMFSADIYNDNTVKCGNCHAELELEPEEILAKLFVCSECERVNEIIDRKVYSRLKENNEARCVSCGRKLILEKEEIERKMFFCPKCGIENYLE